MDDRAESGSLRVGGFKPERRVAADAAPQRASPRALTRAFATGLSGPPKATAVRRSYGGQAASLATNRQPPATYLIRCESYGFPVNGSFGAIGFASNASRLGTTSITPYIRT